MNRPHWNERLLKTYLSCATSILEAMAFEMSGGLYEEPKSMSINRRALVSFDKRKRGSGNTDVRNEELK
jgi:hypothetical protein